MADIYALSTDGVDHRYVGATRDTPGRRLTDHRIKAQKGVVRPVYGWMREVGPSNVTVSLLDRVPDEEIHEAERSWISRLRTEGHDLLNVQVGGPGQAGVPFSGSIAARKRSEAVTGKKRGPYRWADVSRQAQSGAKAAHNRWHLARGVVKDNCVHCTT